jgi:RNA 3'-terminal phosphate cyclase
MNYPCLYGSNVLIHLGVEIVRDISGGKLKGGEIGSTEIVLHPGKVKCGEYSADTGTAG